MESLVFNVRPLNDGFWRTHITFHESGHVYVIVIIDHAALSRYADGCADIVACDHPAWYVCIEQSADGRSGAGLQLVLEDN